MRVAVDVLRVKPDEVEQLFDPLGSLATRYSVRMDSERFTDDVPPPSYADPTRYTGLERRSECHDAVCASPIP